jgi:prepilin-type N-terminal cleavage/methylation domain-containing protein
MRRYGFTLLELLVVISVIGALVAILLPAIQAAREASRRVQCSDHLKNIGLAFINHHDVHKHFPTGGWGWLWTGDPDRGYGIRQPGGWLYNILPYMEEQALHDLGKGLPEGSMMKRLQATQRIQTPLKWAVCPSRREAAAFPVTWQGIPQNPCINCSPPLKVAARSDYSANCSDTGNNEFTGGPGSYLAGDNYAWRHTSCGSYSADRMCGVSFERSQVAVRHIPDGLSKVYLVGERYLNSKKYGTGLDTADNEHMYVGFDNDMFKTAERQPAADGSLRGGPGGSIVLDDSNRWGSVHPKGFRMVFGDGSVHQIPYDIELSVHRRLANRRDGKPVTGEF